jgi:large subunit ribosomal protein L4
VVEENHGDKRGLDVLEPVPDHLLYGVEAEWPSVRNPYYSFKLNRKVRQQAVAMALSARFQEGNLVVLDDFSMEQIRTKEFVKIMNVLDVDNGIIVTDNAPETLSKSSRNVNGYKIISSEGLNVYDLLLHKKVILLQPVIESLEKRLMA